MNRKRVAINGFGRIGRITLRALLKRQDVVVVAINDLSDAKTMAHLFKYDSVHGVYEEEVIDGEKNITIGDHLIYTYSSKKPEQLPWKDLDIDVVIESTGLFRSRKMASEHLKAGAKKVIISAPAKGEESVKTIVLGINGDAIETTDEIISNASCTTNCAAPLVKVVDELWGIESGFLTTVHAYTNDQRLQDAPHSDLRRARAAAVNIIPTTTGAANAVVKIFPHLKGKLTGSALRVPVIGGSLTELTCQVTKSVTVEELNAAFKCIAESELKGYLQYVDAPIVSVDIIGNSYSSIFDAQLTMVQGNLIKVTAWYDNESGYSNRLADLVGLL